MRFRAWIPAIVVLAACAGEEPIAPARPVPMLVGAAWLRQHASEVVLVDMQSSRALYEKGHIAGAVHVTVNELRDERRNLAPPDVLAERLGALGIDENTHVVAYDERHGRNACYLWYALTQLGHEAVSILDGHMKPFAAELVAGPPPEVDRKRYRWRKRPADVVGVPWVRANLGKYVFLDARPPGQYTGEKPKRGMRGGHLEGAVNFFWPELVAEDGTYLDAEASRARMREVLGRELAPDQEIVLYCNSYHDASSLRFHMARMGFTRLLAFDEGMKWWERQELPLKKGDQP